MKQDKSIKTISKFALELISNFKGELLAHNKVATHGLVNSIDLKLYNTVSNIQINFLYDSKGKWIESGRKPGKFVPTKELSTWAQAKNINQKFVYPINLKIQKRGIKAFPFVQNVLKAKNFEQALAQKMQESFQVDLERDIQTFLDANIKQHYN